jgi:hypothetical protein
MRIAIIGGNKISNMLGINFVSNKISDALHPTGAAGFHPHDHRNVQAVAASRLPRDTDGSTRDEAVNA